MNTPQTAIFQAIVRPARDHRRLVGTLLLVSFVYGAVLVVALALTPRAQKLRRREPRGLTVTLLDAPKTAHGLAAGLSGAGASNAVGGAHGDGTTLAKRVPRGARPTPSLKAKSAREATALPVQQESGRVGTGVQMVAKPNVHKVAAARESTAPKVVHAGAATSSAGSGESGVAGGTGGVGAHQEGAGSTRAGAGSGSGDRPGMPSGSTEVLPFQDDMKRPTLLSKVDPTYTREARDANVEGLILAKCVITTSGSLQRCRIVKGIPMMDQAVLSALAQWRYSPVVYRGAKTAVDYLIPVRLVAH